MIKYLVCGANNDNFQEEPRCSYPTLYNTKKEAIMRLEFLKKEFDLLKEVLKE